MARKVFYSFHYANDIWRVMEVRNRWVTRDRDANEIIDKAEFEKIKRKGTNAVCRWIDKQLSGTSATVVLIGEETLDRPFVRYEICKSLSKGNAIIGVLIHDLEDKDGFISLEGHVHTVVGKYNDGSPIYFDEIADAIYDYSIDDGYNNLGDWVEDAVLQHRH